MHSQACVEEQPTHTDAQHRQAPTPYETVRVDQLIRRLSATTPEALAAEADRPALMGFAKRLGVTGYGKMTTDQLVTVVINAAKTAQQRKSQFFSRRQRTDGCQAQGRRAPARPHRYPQASAVCRGERAWVFVGSEARRASQV